MTGESVQFEDYYDLLGVEPAASRSAIMRAYRRQVTRYHPDRRDGQSGVDAAVTFKHLSQARSILSNPARRAEYDRLGHDAYLARRNGDGPLTPDAGGRSPPRASVTDGPAWYDPDNASATRREPTASEERGGATVVEGTETTIEDLLRRDPIEAARRAFRRVWVLRVTVTGLLAVALLGVGGSIRWLSPPVIALAVVLVVALTGAVAQRRTPRASKPTTPPPNASIGRLRPAAAARYRRRGLAALVLGVGLTLLATPTRVISRVGGTIAGETTPWIGPGTLGAPQFVGPLNALVGIVLLVSSVAGTLALVLGVSAASWYRYHGRHSPWWPLAVDLAVLAGVAALWTLPLAVGSGTLDWLPRSALLGLSVCGLVLVLALTRWVDTTG